MRVHFGPRFPFGKDPSFPPMGLGPKDWGDWDFDLDLDFSRGAGSGRRGGRRRMFESGEFRLVLLKLISDEPRHGYDIIRAIEEMTHGSYAPSPGVVYPTLTMLEDMGLISESEAEGSRKVFSITPAGEAHLTERADEVEVLMARLESIGEGKKKAGGGRPIKRAVRNLLTALGHRVARGEFDEETMHEIATILDDAAQKIERLK